MKSMSRYCLFVIALSSVIFGVTVTFDPSQDGSKIIPAHMAGTCLPVWNSATIYKDIKKGLATSNYRLFRFPNGSISNGYHWNGSGAYSAEGIWNCDSTVYQPGFVSMTKYRGTSVNNYGFSGCSNVTDGDTATFWQSDESITGSMPYCYLELSMTGTVDSIVILWGDRYAEDFDVDFFGVWGSFYPGPFKHSEDLWPTRKKVTGNSAKVTALWLDSTLVTRYVRVIARKYAPEQKTVQIREIYCFSKGKQITTNIKTYTGGSTGSQTKVIAEPTSAASVVRPDASGWKTWHFETFMDYVNTIDSASVPVICVNYGTGTSEEAARWVHYANVVKKYRIKFWQVGNEMDGEWEEGGPVSAKMYAEKFVQFSKAMKAVDPSIKVLGPVLSNADFNARNSGSYDGKSWMQGFMEYVGAKEKADTAKYCDGIDFHSYPYWSTGPAAAGMMAKVDYAAGQCDSLIPWITSYLADPDSAYVMMSEFNSSVVMSDLVQKRINGIFLANMYAGHTEKFGNRAMSVVWDSYEGGEVGPLLTWGALSLFNALPGTQYSSMTKAPSSGFWGLYLLQNIWIDPQGENTIVKAAYKKDSVRAYGIKTPKDFRALFINVSPVDSIGVDCTISNGSYSHAEVYSWGPSEFGWIGSDKNSYAFPNCGPSSRIVASADLKTMKMPPLSLCVVRYFNPDSNDAAPAFVHVGSKDRICTDTARFVFYASATGGINAMRAIEYAVDSAKNFTALKPLDGAFDGTSENIVDSISVTSIPAGRHLLYLRARTQSSKTAIDSVLFYVQGKLYPVTLIDNFNDSDFVPVLPGSTPWAASVNVKNESKITPAVIKRNGPDNCYNGAFTIVQPTGLTYQNFVQINSYADSNYIKTNAGRFKGITFSYSATNSSATGAFFIHILSRKVLDNKDWCEFYIPLSATGGGWRTVTFGWSDFHQYPWGIQVGMLDAADVRGFEFRAQGEGTGTFAFDNMAFLGDSGAEINLPVRQPQALHAPSRLIVKETRSAASVHFSVSGFQKALTIKAFVYTVDGKMIKEIAGDIKDETVAVSWKYDRKDEMPVAKGVYFVMIKAGGKAIYNGKVVVQ